jgi:copper homeostasis protein
MTGAAAGTASRTAAGEPLLEVIACTVEDALAAERGGAHRLELVRDLGRGGLTPSPAVVAEIVRAVRIPVRVMIREDEPFVVTDARTVQPLCETASTIGRLGVEGLVLGFLDASGAVDEGVLGRVLREAPGVRATFHRAFEEVADVAAAFGALARWPQIDRVLVNGGSGSAGERLAALRALAAQAPPGIRVLSAVGSDRSLLAAVWAEAALGEAHVGRAARDPEAVDAPVSAERVRALLAGPRPSRAPADHRSFSGGGQVGLARD